MEFVMKNKAFYRVAGRPVAPTRIHFLSRSTEKNPTLGDFRFPRPEKKSFLFF